MTVGINQELSPIKFCFFIKPDIASLQRTIQVANCFWGGKASPIFPLMERFDGAFRATFSAHEPEEEFYKNILNNFNPDIIVLEDGLSGEFVAKISGNRLVLGQSDLEDSILKFENRYGLTILEVIYEIITGMFEYKRNDDLHIHLALNENEDPLISILFNTPIKAISKIIESNLRENDFVKATDVRIGDLHALRASNSLGYGDVNLYKLLKLKSFGDYYEYVFIFKRDDISSLTILWNLKAAGRKVFAFPISDYANGELDEGLLDFYSKVNEGEFGPSIFCGPYVTRAQFDNAFKYIEQVVRSKYENQRISYQPWIPRFGSDGGIAQKDGVVSSVFVLKIHYDQVKSEEGYVRYNLLKTDFKTAKNTTRNTHKITSYIKYHDHLLNHPSVIDGIDNLDWVRMTHSISSDDYRISNGGVIKFCDGDRSDIHFKIPETKNYLKTFFKKKKLTFSITPNGELTRQIFKNIGGIYGIGRFSSIGAVKVLEALENETVLSSEHLVSLIKQFKPNYFENGATNFISILLENNIIELGVLIQCTICFQRSFYSLDEISTKVVCKNCRSTYAPPQNNPKETFKWSYRGIGPFSRNNKVDGLLSGFFTLNLFEHGVYVANDGITSFMNFQLEGLGNPMEVDLMIQLRAGNFSEDEKTELIFCECKTYRNFTQVDIDRLKFLGEMFPGSILVLSSLNEKLTPDEVALVSSLVNHFRTGYGKRPLNSVFILTSNELLPRNPDRVFQHFGKVHPAIRHNDYLGFLCEKSCEVYLGLRTWTDLKSEEWIAEQNRRVLLGGIMHGLTDHIANRT